jgi:hypothetical protein
MNEINYQFHMHLNRDKESVDTRLTKTDFGSVMKVDNHIHLVRTHRPYQPTSSTTTRVICCVLPHCVLPHTTLPIYLRACIKLS